MATETLPTDMITTTLGDLVVAEEALGRLMALTLPIKTAYHLAKLARLVKAETREFSAQRERFIRDLGVVVAPTPEQLQAGISETIQVTPENRQVFEGRLRELADIAVTIPWRPVRISDLGDIAVSASDLLVLGSLVDMEA